MHERFKRIWYDVSIRRIAASPYPYLVFYEIEGEDIIIRRIRHAARDPHSMPGSS
jgi:toxin ParE1/3/4